MSSGVKDTEPEVNGADNHQRARLVVDNEMASLTTDAGLLQSLLLMD